MNKQRNNNKLKSKYSDKENKVNQMNFVDQPQANRPKTRPKINVLFFIIS